MRGRIHDWGCGRAGPLLLSHGLTPPGSVLTLWRARWQMYGQACGKAVWHCRRLRTPCRAPAATWGSFRSE